MNYNSKEIKNRRSIKSYIVKPKWYDHLIDYVILLALSSVALTILYLGITTVLTLAGVNNASLLVYLIFAPAIALILYFLYKRKH
jgi:hypothetical protein